MRETGLYLILWALAWRWTVLKIPMDCLINKFRM